VLCLDNDEVGRIATEAIKTLLPEVYIVQDMPPPEGKDYNDCLMAYKQLNHRVKTRGAKSAPYHFKEDISK
jgi:DNA primase